MEGWRLGWRMDVVEEMAKGVGGVLVKVSGVRGRDGGVGWEAGSELLLGLRSVCGSGLGSVCVLALRWARRSARESGFESALRLARRSGGGSAFESAIR